MGQARLRGSFDERRAIAIASGRVPAPKKQSAIVFDLGEALAILLSVGKKKTPKPAVPAAAPETATQEAEDTHAEHQAAS